MKKKTAYGALALLLCLLLAAALYYHLPALAYYWTSMHGQPESAHEQSIWLPAYTAIIDGRVVEGINENASGLTFNPRTGTLFTVINSPQQVAELTVEGELLRLIPLEGAGDPEGITHVEDDLFALADETLQQIFYVRIDAATTTIDVRDAPRLGLGLDLGDNVGFEGISWDYARKRLFVSKEKSPLRVLEISGLHELIEGGPLRLDIREWKATDAFALFLIDLSSLTLHEATGHMLLLSDESRLIVEYDARGEPVSIMPLWGGRHGLSRSVPQAEGIAMDEAGDIYALSEPNLFYRFRRSHTADWMKNTAAVPN